MRNLRRTPERSIHRSRTSTFPPNPITQQRSRTRTPRHLASEPTRRASAGSGGPSYREAAVEGHVKTADSQSSSLRWKSALARWLTARSRRDNTGSRDLKRARVLRNEPRRFGHREDLPRLHILELSHDSRRPFNSTGAGQPASLHCGSPRPDHDSVVGRELWLARQSSCPLSKRHSTRSGRSSHQPVD